MSDEDLPKASEYLLAKLYKQYVENTKLRVISPPIFCASLIASVIVMCVSFRFMQVVFGLHLEIFLRSRLVLCQ